MWQRVNHRNVGKWVRVAAVVVMMLQMLLVPAAQAQSQLGQDVQGAPTLQCHPVVTADCAGGQVTLSGDGSYHDVTIWLDNDSAHPLVHQDHVKAGTWNFDWSVLGVNVCAGHTLKATWSGSNQASFGGSSCCTGKLLTSHIECVEAEHKIEVHFVLNQSPSWPDYSGSSVSFSMSTPYGTVNGSAAFSNRTPGGVCHYYFYTSNCPDGTYAVTSGSLTVEGVTWNLENNVSVNISGCQEYVPCTETTDWQLLSTGAWHYHPDTGKVCRDKVYVKYDLHDPTHECERKTEEDCSYVPCTETTDWVITGYGDWHYDESCGKWCRDVFKVKYDKYIPEHVCERFTDKECKEYEPCTETTDWVITGYGEWHYDESCGKWCRDVFKVKYDKYIPDHVCERKTDKECKEYEPCTETTDWVITGYGEWHWVDDSKCEYHWCRDVYMVKYDKYIPGYICDKKTEQECKEYEPCSETTDWIVLWYGKWHYDESCGKWCRDVYKVKYDKYIPFWVCDTKTEQECKEYEPCTETTDWVITGYGEWHYDESCGKWCHDVYMVKYDKYVPGYICDKKTDQECVPYVPCTETLPPQTVWGEWYYENLQWCRDGVTTVYDAHLPGVICSQTPEHQCTPYNPCDETLPPETVWGEWHYDAASGQWCRDGMTTVYDAHMPGYICHQTPEQECVPYEPCTETTDWVVTGYGEWHYVDGGMCRDVFEVKYDKNMPEHVCERQTDQDCVPYVPCTETVLGGEISRRGPEFVDGQLCWWVTYALVDKYTGEQCGTTELERCEPYQGCSVTRRSRELSREGPFYVSGQVCYKVTYELVDAYTGEVCGQETVDECQPVGNGCNTPSINPSVTSQGHSVTVSFSAWGPGITGIQVYLLGDAQDGPHPGGGGAWYLLASTGPEGGSVTIDTSWLFPKNRTIWIKAIYPGGWWSCYGHFRVTPGPTPTLPVPGFVPCPTCVKPVVYQSNASGQWDIYKANEDGSNEMRLTDNAGADKAPHWHPSGTEITFQSDRDGNWEVYTMNADGSNQMNVSQNTAADVAPYWSCQYIYFMSDRDGNWEIYRMNRDGTQQTRLTNNAATDAEPSTSCNERVAFQSKRDGNWEIYTMNFDGTDVKRLTNTPWNETAPEWSPNGEWIVFQTDKTGQAEIAVMDVNGGNLRTIVRSASPDEAPAWHPYCEWIYFQTYRSGSWEIYRTNQDGTVTQRVGIRASSAEQLDDGSY